MSEERGWTACSQVTRAGTTYTLVEGPGEVRVYRASEWIATVADLELALALAKADAERINQAQAAPTEEP